MFTVLEFDLLSRIWMILFSNHQCPPISRCLYDQSQFNYTLHVFIQETHRREKLCRNKNRIPLGFQRMTRARLTFTKGLTPDRGLMPSIKLMPHMVRYQRDSIRRHILILKKLVGTREEHPIILQQELWGENISLENLGDDFIERKLKMILFLQNFLRVDQQRHEVKAGAARLDQLNYANIVLIPKNNRPKRVGDFRPIALLNHTIKIFFLD